MSSEQLVLDLSPLTALEYEPHLSIPERFALFHAANPHVADALEVLAAEWLAGRSRISARDLYARLRWESGIRTEGDVYLLNNDFTAHYARLLIDRRPEWATAFHLRELRAF